MKRLNHRRKPGSAPDGRRGSNHESTISAAQRWQSQYGPKIAELEPGDACGERSLLSEVNQCAAQHTACCRVEYKQTVTTASACFVFAAVGSQAAHDDSEQRQRKHWTARRGFQPVFGCKYGQRSCPFGNDLFTATLTQRIHRLLFKKDFSRARPCVRELDLASGVKFRWF